MMNTAHTAKAKHIRGRLKAAGIKAKCRAYVACGVQYITINPPTFEAAFSDEQQKNILVIADCNGLTLSRGGKINLDQRTYEKTATFEFHGGEEQDCFPNCDEDCPKHGHIWRALQTH